MRQSWPVALFVGALGVAGCAAYFDSDREYPDYAPRTVTNGFNDEYREWILRAAETCEAITPQLLAAQIEAESSFRSDALSPAGAMGPAQFIPSTWEIWGIDADEDGMADPYSIPDAITAQAAFMCDNHRRATEGVATGQLDGDPLDLALAAYNAGFGAVQRFEGLPEGGEYTTQTRPYVERIRAREAHYIGEL